MPDPNSSPSEFTQVVEFTHQRFYGTGQHGVDGPSYKLRCHDSRLQALQQLFQRVETHAELSAREGAEIKSVLSKLIKSAQQGVVGNAESFIRLHRFIAEHERMPLRQTKISSTPEISVVLGYGYQRFYGLGGYKGPDGPLASYQLNPSQMSALSKTLKAVDTNSELNDAQKEKVRSILEVAIQMPSQPRQPRGSKQNDRHRSSWASPPLKDGLSVSETEQLHRFIADNSRMPGVFSKTGAQSEFEWLLGFNPVSVIGTGGYDYVEHAAGKQLNKLKFAVLSSVLARVEDNSGLSENEKIRVSSIVRKHLKFFKK